MDCKADQDRQDRGTEGRGMSKKSIQISASEARAKLSETVKRAGSGERMLITSKGKPAAAMISMEELERIKRFEQQIENEISIHHISAPGWDIVTISRGGELSTYSKNDSDAIGAISRTRKEGALEEHLRGVPMIGSEEATGEAADIILDELLCEDEHIAAVLTSRDRPSESNSSAEFPGGWLKLIPAETSKD